MVLPTTNGSFVLRMVLQIQVSTIYGVQCDRGAVTRTIRTIETTVVVVLLFAIDGNHLIILYQIWVKNLLLILRLSVLTTMGIIHHKIVYGLHVKNKGRTKELYCKIHIEQL